MGAIMAAWCCEVYRKRKEHVREPQNKENIPQKLNN